MQLMEEFDLAWRESLAQPWKERHAFMQAMRERLAAYEDAARERELDEAEQWELAGAVEAVKGSRAALAVLDELLRRAPQHAPALYARGRIRLEDNDEGGAADIERAMQLDDEAREPGAQLLYTYFYARHDLSRCDRYRGTLQQVQQERQLAAAERAQLRVQDVLHPHGLDADALASWIEVLSRDKSVRRAWLARKQVRHLPRIPAYVLCVQFKLLSSGGESRLAQLGNASSAGHDCLAVSGVRATRRLRKLDGALIFER
jgi:hypothetical protein